MGSTRPPNEMQLDVDEIQGDILVGLQKDKQAFITFEIVDVPAFKEFLKLLAPRVTTMRVALEREFILEARKKSVSERLTFVGITVAFTFEGLAKLGVWGLDKIGDDSFRAGLAANSHLLNDPTTGEGSPDNWVVGGKGQALHGVLTVAGPTEPPIGPHPDPVEAQAALLEALAGPSWRVLRKEFGQTREDARGHEHFGFRDGVSQPAVRGRIDQAFPSRTFLNPGRNPNDPGQGLPGQDLVWPGEFVFGYPAQGEKSDDPPIAEKQGGPLWMKNGSFLVYRRLKQFVPEFERFVEERADALGVDPDLLAARMVGRWKSGAPLVTAPLQDDLQLGADPLFNNAFEFSQDKDGRRCPFAAHIRKSYPRNDINEDVAEKKPNNFDKREISEGFAERRRILRAGISYGPKVSDDEKRQHKTDDVKGDRGLMFVCYQTSIADQFEFIVRNWINNPDFARKEVGEDPLLGQAGGDRKRHFAGAVPTYPTGDDGDPIELPTYFIVPTGGGYFFAPSIKALVETFAKRLGSDEPARMGAWDPVMQMPNVPVHMHLLPDGNVLFWGRRENAAGSMDQHVCTPHIWDRNKKLEPDEPPSFLPTPQPKATDGSTVNLFCSGHTFLPDGRLFVAGGHFQDGHGINQVCVYDWRSKTWTPLQPMTHGRWYPSATSLPDGAILVTSGSYGSGEQTPNNSVPQVWDGTAWTDLADKVVSLYPRMIVLEDGRVFVAGTDPDAFMLDPLNSGTWSPAPARTNGDRQYAPAVMYAPNKIIFIGGGNDPDNNLRPTSKTEVIDFNDLAPAWKPAASMLFPRRQHNATLLPDGTVLVTGGTRGPGFNDLTPGDPVHAAELWDPKTNQWTELAAEDKDRCYHSAALLLPDATVLSAGGGEYFAQGNTIDPKDVHKEGQIFRPPYLFWGARPVIRSGPDGADYGSTFILTLDGAVEATRVTALRLGSVTHSMDTNQRLVELTFTAAAGATLTITAPVGANACPPGNYMVFALSVLSVPSEAHIMRFGSDAGPRDRRGVATQAAAARIAKEAERASAPKGTFVKVGLMSRCPYGLAACWAGAKQSLAKLDGVSLVEQQADAKTSTAGLWLIGTGLPDLERWMPQFEAAANGSYDIRGFEVSVAGTLRRHGTALELRVDGDTVRLERLGESQKVQWDWDRKAREPIAPAEADAFARLLATSKPKGAVQVMVTGPLRLEHGTPVISVREFSASPPKPRALKRPPSARKTSKRS